MVPVPICVRRDLIQNMQEIQFTPCATVLPFFVFMGCEQEDGACQDCVYNISCTGTLAGSACELSLPIGETSDGQLTLASEELETGESYTLQASLRRTLRFAGERCQREVYVIGHSVVQTLCEESWSAWSEPKLPHTISI